MKIKLLHTVVVIFLTFALLLSGCSSKTTEETASKESGPVTVEFWTFPDWGVGDAGDLFKTFVTEFETANPDIKINFVPKADLEQSIIAGAGSGVYPDAFTVAFNQGDTFLRTGIVEDVASYYNALPAEYGKQFNSGWINALSPDGQDRKSVV